ncbi:sugar O-acetyltransferase [Bacteroides sp. 519]|uniref:sugar O-acetyltransferase n=1 Tax=Bacteroides sp. 519 TaxID=2302937 RepID=UPI0013D0A504|nr:sugar O-acetyltransferase [Bacteroides sp. 519]NDV60408.1 sugar O-acetyltransferase [Bacteroides sp. 519]
MKKTEKEKMLAGELYDAGDKELITRWHLAKKLMKEYYAADTSNRALLDSILDELLGSRGENVWITAPFYVDYGENIHLGNNVEINMNCVFLDCNKITIGDNSGIGPNTQIYAVTHPVMPSERLTMSEDGSFSFWKSYTAPVTIGSNVWIGGNSTILPGMSIGDNTTIGAGSLVTKSIPANCLAYGNPCKIVREIPPAVP